MNGAKRLIRVPKGALVVLCGVSGSGKSTLAQRHFSPTQIVSSDHCRAMLSDDPTNQKVSYKAFELMHWIIDERLHFRHTTAVDSTALNKNARLELLRIARRQHAPTIFVCLNVSLKTCIERDRARERSVGPEVIERQYAMLQKTLLSVQSEDWDQIVVLTDGQIESAEFVSQLGSFDLRHLQGPFDIIGDVHGCLDELRELIDKLGYVEQQNGVLSHPQRRCLVFLGDLADRGPYNAEAFAFVMSLTQANVALYTPGNHCNKLMRYLQGRKVHTEQGLEMTIGQVEARDDQQPGFKDQLRRFIENAPTYLWLDGGALAVTHGGLKEWMIGQDRPSVQRMCLYGDATGRMNPDGTPERLDWAAEYVGKTAIIYGHTPTPGPVWKNNTINIDQGCVFGGWMTALRWPEREIAQVKARQAYYTARTPEFLAASQ